MLRLSPSIWTMVWLALAAGASWALGWPPIPFLPAHEAVGMALFFVAWIVPVWSYRLFLRARTDVDPRSQSHARLVVGGPYRYTRNPMYLGLVAASLGMAIWVGAWPMLAAPALVFLTVALAHVRFEEASLRHQFGEAYEAYAARVRRWI